ncbi:MAG TPA: nuclear transport factor 2 family protein [Longimicrobiaceae bacterium]|nr:nuclear transport factor 2 family protein [Longimicrobiaceae bacterium]
MNRLLVLALSTTLALAACKVERTPPEFFDQRSPAANDREAALGELRARLALLAQALSRADAAGALLTFTPAAGAFVIGVGPNQERAGREAISSALQQITAQGPVQLEVQDMQLAVGPRANVAWFAAYLTAPGLAPREESTGVLRISGVYVLHEGTWQLAQAHLSFPASTPPDTLGDTISAPAAYPAGEAAPPE